MHTTTQSIILFCLVQSVINFRKDDFSRFMINFEDYEKNIRPGYPGPPVQVNMTMFIRDMSSISEKTMDYTITFNLRHFWNDKRLVFNETETGVDTLIVGPEFASKIWLPDTFFRNSKDVKLHQTATSDRDMLLRIKSNGDVLFGCRFTVTAACAMDLHYFPMDVQKCNLELASYGFTAKDLVYEWRGPKALGLSNRINLPHYKLRSAKQGYQLLIGRTGNYSDLIMEFHLIRSIGFYLYHIYIPAILIVIISWVPFWLERDDSHARVALTVTTVLTMTTLMTNTNESLPKISYVKAIDIFLFTCFLMVFGAFIESSVVGYFEKWQHKKSKIDVEQNGRTKERRKDSIRSSEGASMFDRISRVVFPLLFLVFNLAYWLFYLDNTATNLDELNVLDN